MKKYCIALSIIALCALSPRAMAQGSSKADDEAMEEWLRMPVRRLHPERPTANQLKEQREKEKAEKKREKAERDQKKAQAQSAGYRYSRQATAEQHAADARKKAYLDSLLAIEYTVPTYTGPVRLTWKDEPVKESRDQLLPSFTRSEVASGQQRYMPKDVTMSNDDNALYFYFDVKNKRPLSLRLRGQYFADDPLNIEQLKFVIDGFDYDFTPTGVEHGTQGSNLYWENFDNSLSGRDKDLIYALAHCTWARVTYIGGRGFNHVKMLTKEQIRDFYNTLELYRAMGGSL